MRLKPRLNQINSLLKFCRCLKEANIRSPRLPTEQGASAGSRGLSRYTERDETSRLLKKVEGEGYDGGHGEDGEEG